ncbi:MAG: porin [Rhodospirillales bacterium]|nr:porin [Rhodospirillales bacterium]
MKKVLFGTTALVAAGMFGSAAQAAEPIKLSVGGFMNQFVVIGDTDAYTYNGSAAIGAGSNRFTREYGNVGIVSDTEVHFKGSTTLDNGLKVAVVIELEAERTATSTARNADQQYVALSGGWGQVRVGEMFNAAQVVHNQAPTVGAGNADVTTFFTASVPNGAGLTTMANAFTSADGIANAGRASTAIDYISPMFGPFAFGLTYTPNVLSRGFAQESASLNDLAGVAFVYADKWGPVGVNADVAYARFDYDHSMGAAGTLLSNATGVVHAVPVGGKISYAGFDLGGSYIRIMDSLSSGRGNAGAGLTADAASGSYDGAAWDAGVAYTTGPWKFAYAYYASSLEGRLRVHGKDEHQIHNIGGQYTMGPGVIVSVNGVYQEYREEDSATVGSKQEAFGFVTGLKLTF